MVHTKEISPASADVLSAGFAALFLNRTNRSGIIKNAGPIGEKGQSGTYKIDCRFNKENIIERILRISEQKDRIHLTRLNAREFLLRYGTDENTFFIWTLLILKKEKVFILGFTKLMITTI
ncbi:hypothetical protein [Bartonella sp. CL46QHWL]|uniref:hypothetical protein n=1 Tax=Bartonella sp. CL46QHWL TaxID=3243534 RepID=UPI0035CFD892